MHPEKVNLAENHKTPMVSEIRTKQATNEEKDCS